MFKNSQLFILTVMILGLSLAAQASGFSSRSTLVNFNIKSCLKSKCVSLESKKADSGNFVAIYTFKNFKLIRAEGENQQITAGLSGYFDFQNSIMVLKTDKNEELLIDLNTMESKVYPL